MMHVVVKVEAAVLTSCQRCPNGATVVGYILHYKREGPAWPQHGQASVRLRFLAIVLNKAGVFDVRHGGVAAIAVLRQRKILANLPIQVIRVVDGGVAHVLHVSQRVVPNKKLMVLKGILYHD